MSDVIDYGEQHNIRVQEYKKVLMNFGILAGIILIMFGVLVLFTITSRKSVDNGIKEQVQKVLDDCDLDFNVGDSIDIEATISYSMRAYRLVSLDGKCDSIAVIMRCPTMFGAQAALFIYNVSTSSAYFIDFANISGMAKKVIVDATMKSQIEYWVVKIPQIFSKTDF